MSTANNLEDNIFGTYHSIVWCFYVCCIKIVCARHIGQALMVDEGCSRVDGRPSNPPFTLAQCNMSASDQQQHTKTAIGLASSAITLAAVSQEITSGPDCAMMPYPFNSSFARASATSSGKKGLDPAVFAHKTSNIPLCVTACL